MSYGNKIATLSNIGKIEEEQMNENGGKEKTLLVDAEI